MKSILRHFIFGSAGFCLLGAVDLHNAAAAETAMSCSTHSISADIIGSAYDKSGKLAYCEYYNKANSRQENDNTVEYRSPDGELLAYKSYVELNQPGLVTFDQQHQQHNELRSVTLKGNQFDSTFRKHDSNTVETKAFSLDEVDIIDAGFDTWIEEHWEKLLDYKAVSVNYLSPPHLRTFPLQIVRQKKCTETYFCFEIRSTNRLIRLVAPKIELTYDSDKRLRTFSGITNLTQANGKSHRVTIQYGYPDLESKVSTSLFDGR